MTRNIRWHAVSDDAQCRMAYLTRRYAGDLAQAAENDVSLFVLPEALLARDDHDADLSVKSAQLLEGEFLGLYGEKVNVT